MCNAWLFQSQLTNFQLNSQSTILPVKETCIVKHNFTGQTGGTK